MEQGQLNRLWVRDHSDQPVEGSLLFGHVWSNGKWHRTMDDRLSRIIELEKNHTSDLILGKKVRAILNEK